MSEVVDPARLLRVCEELLALGGDDARITVPASQVATLCRQMLACVQSEAPVYGIPVSTPVPSSQRVHTAMHFNNGMVMVFSGDGQLIPDLQGEYTDMKDMILAQADAQTRFLHSAWNGEQKEVSRADW